MAKTAKTKNQKLYSFLNKEGRTLTAAQAITKFDVKNLRARISDLRNKYGWNIEATRTRKNPSVATYKVLSVGTVLA